MGVFVNVFRKNKNSKKTIVETGHAPLIDSRDHFCCSISASLFAFNCLFDL
jgi:hypothetical protein